MRSVEPGPVQHLETILVSFVNNAYMRLLRPSVTMLQSGSLLASYEVHGLAVVVIVSSFMGLSWTEVVKDKATFGLKCDVFVWNHTFFTEANTSMTQVSSSQKMQQNRRIPMVSPASNRVGDLAVMTANTGVDISQWKSTKTLKTFNSAFPAV